MTGATLPAGHGRASILQLGRHVAAELAGEAVDPTAHLTMTDRLALAALSLAVDIEVSARAGVEPCTARARAWLAAELAEIERGDSP